MKDLGTDAFGIPLKRTKEDIKNLLNPKPKKSDFGEYILLPGKTRVNHYGTYEYPDILVSTQKIYFEKNWYLCHEELQKQDSFMLTPRQFFDWRELLKSGKAYDGNGKKMNGARIENIMCDVFGKGKPTKNPLGEWLDFEITDEIIFYAQYPHTFIDGQLQARKKEHLEPCLTKSGYIDVATMNRQGLPTAFSDTKDIFYNPPREVGDSVTLFSSSDLGPTFFCNMGPSDSYKRIGVRKARIR